MAIIFKKIGTDETIAIDRKTGGQYYHAKLSAAINSSNLSINADRGQDFGWRLSEEQQVIIEMWEEDPQMIDKVSQYTKVPVDNLTHSEFLAYLVHEQELGQSPERAELAKRREDELAYERRVAELKAQKRAEAMPAFNPESVAGLDEFMSGELTGDASGDKVVTGVDLAKKGDDRTEVAVVKAPKAKK